MKFFQSNDHAVAEALRKLEARIESYEQAMATMIEESSSKVALIRSLGQAAKERDHDSVTIELAHQHAMRLVALHGAGRKTSRDRGEHGLTQDAWSWANAVLVASGVRGDGGAWKRISVEEAMGRIGESLKRCRRTGIAPLRRHNAKNVHDRRRRCNGTKERRARGKTFVVAS